MRRFRDNGYFANGQQIANLWNGGFTLNGGNVTIAANGGWQSFGFMGTWDSVNNDPNAFSLNGRPCSAG